MAVSKKGRASGQGPDRLGRTSQSVLSRSMEPTGGFDDLVERAFPILHDQVVTVAIAIGLDLR